MDAPCRYAGDAFHHFPKALRWTDLITMDVRVYACESSSYSQPIGEEYTVDIKEWTWLTAVLTEAAFLKGSWLVMRSYDLDDLPQSLQSSVKQMLHPESCMVSFPLRSSNITVR